MTPKDLQKIKTIVFDMDGVLHDGKSYTHMLNSLHRTFESYVQQNLPEKRGQSIRDVFFDVVRTHGSPVRYIAKEHPHLNTDDYQSHIHNFDLPHTHPCPLLQKCLKQLDQTKIVYTDSPRFFARKVLGQRGLLPLIHGLFTSQDAKDTFKSHLKPHFLFLIRHGLKAEETLMIEDTHAPNLINAKAAGMTTVHIHGVNKPPVIADHIDYSAPTLTDFLLSVISPPAITPAITHNR